MSSGSSLRSRATGLTRADYTLAGIAAVGLIAASTALIQEIPQLLVLGTAAVLWTVLLADALFRNPPPVRD